MDFPLTVMLKGFPNHNFTIVSCSTPSPYLNQCWIITNRTLKNNFSEIVIQNTNHTRKWTCKCRLRNGGHFVSSTWHPMHMYSCYHLWSHCYLMNICVWVVQFLVIFHGNLRIRGLLFLGRVTSLPRHPNCATVVVGIIRYIRFQFLPVN